MSKAHLLGLAFGLAICAMALPSDAAPVSGAGTLEAVAGERSAVHDVHWRRRCWWHRGHWHCRRYVRHWYPRHGYYPDYPRRHHRYRYGPRFGIWGPGFGFYAGPRRHRYW
jgi:hypothetical protein